MPVERPCCVIRSHTYLVCGVVAEASSITVFTWPFSLLTLLLHACMP